MTRTSSWISLLPPSAAHPVVFQHAQELGLGGHRHVPDFVQQHGAVLRQLEAAGAAFHGPRERAFFVAEQLAFHESVRHGGAVDGDERPAAPGAQRVDRARGQFLACSAFPGDQHGGAAGGYLLNQGEYLAHLSR